METLTSASKPTLLNLKTYAHSKSILSVAFANAHGKALTPRFLGVGVSE